MPLLDPKQIHQVLKAEGPPAGVGLSPAKNSSALQNLLEKNNLTADECLDNLSSLMRSAESDTTRLAAAKVGLELNQLINSKNPDAGVSITINIVDSDFSTNPILIPRNA